MSAQPAPSPSESIPDAPAPVSILFNLAPELQTAVVLRALICAEEAGYQRGLSAALAAISRPSDAQGVAS